MANYDSSKTGDEITDSVVSSSLYFSGAGGSAHVSASGNISGSNLYIGSNIYAGDFNSVSASGNISGSNLYAHTINVAASSSFGSEVSGSLAGADATDKTLGELLRQLTKQGIISSSFI
tara:strand:- start:55 stop:411 length:357 start_codon:yes stop_codon:yes gene_type:complete